MNVDIIDEILKKHTVVRDIHKGINRPVVYDIGDDIELYIKQSYNNLVMWAFDNKIDRFINLEDDKYNSLIDGFKRVALEFKVTNEIYNIRLDLNKTNLEYIESINDNKRRVIGYCRIGRKSYIGENEIDKQEEAILMVYPNANICREIFTGTKLNRPVIDNLLDELESGDMLVVTKLDRLALNAKDGITILDRLFSKNIIIHVLNVGILENSTLGRFFIQTILATIEMESALKRERIEEGKEIAKQKPGFKDGRPKSYNDEQLDEALSMLAVNGGKFSYDKVVEITKISKSTLIRENKKRKN